MLVGSPAAPSEKVSVVSQLYQEFAWEAVIAEPQLSEQGLLDQPRAVLVRYFEGSLVQLILQDRSEVAKSHEVGRLDFLPIWDSQDPAATDLRVVDGPTRDTVSVSFRYPGRDQPIQLTYHLTKTPNGWRISDIEYASGYRLREILQGKE
jgi:hypothetical protein